MNPYIKTFRIITKNFIANIIDWRKNNYYESNCEGKYSLMKSISLHKFKILIFSFIITFFIGLGIFHTITAVKGNQKQDMQYKYYTSITIEYGDSLWTIAQKYCNDKEKLPLYVQELKEINGLSEETIHAGNNLVVYYYSNEYK